VGLKSVFKGLILLLSGTCNHVIRQIGENVLKEPAAFIFVPADGDSFSGTCYVVTQQRDVVCQKNLMCDFSHK